MYRIWVYQLLTVIYFTSMVDNVTFGCLLLNYEASAWPKNEIFD